MALYPWFTMIIISAMLISSPTTLLMCTVGLALSFGVSICLNLSLWVGYSFLMLYLGGLLILFMYVVSTLNTEEVSVLWIKKNQLLLLMGVGLLLLKLMISTQMNHSISTVSEVFCGSSAPSLLLITLYLMSILLVANSMMEKFKGTHKCI